MAWNVKILTKS